MCLKVETRLAELTGCEAKQTFCVLCRVKANEPPGQTAGSCKHLQAFDWRKVDPGWRPDLGWQPIWVHVNGH